LNSSSLISEVVSFLWIYKSTSSGIISVLENGIVSASTSSISVLEFNHFAFYHDSQSWCILVNTERLRLNGHTIVLSAASEFNLGISSNAQGGDLVFDIDQVQIWSTSPSRSIIDPDWSITRGIAPHLRDFQSITPLPAVWCRFIPPVGQIPTTGGQVVLTGVNASRCMITANSLSKSGQQLVLSSVPWGVAILENIFPKSGVSVGCQLISLTGFGFSNSQLLRTFNGKSSLVPQDSECILMKTPPLNFGTTNCNLERCVVLHVNSNLVYMYTSKYQSRCECSNLYVKSWKAFIN